MPSNQRAALSPEYQLSLTQAVLAGGVMTNSVILTVGLLVSKRPHSISLFVGINKENSCCDLDT
jgi:hypothetical protein